MTFFYLPQLAMAGQNIAVCRQALDLTFTRMWLETTGDDMVTSQYDIYHDIRPSINDYITIFNIL